MAAEKRYWLMKTEGDVYSISDLKRDGVAPWDGVRNFQARNFMREMHLGDLVLLYHSSAADIGVYGVAKVVALAHPDTTQFDKGDPHYDPTSRREKPKWYCVDVRFVRAFRNPVLLEEMRSDPELRGMLVLERGRLSVQPVSKGHFERVLALARGKG